MSDLIVKPEKPPLDYVWRSRRIATAASNDFGNLRVRLDSMFAPDFRKAYAAAWQALMPRASELAIPILYLQRHALELSVKDTIRSLLTVREVLQLGHEVFGLPGPPLAPKEHRLLDGHQFGPLLACLSENIRAFELGSLPNDFFAARKILEDIERGDPTRLRYDTLRRTWRSSFEYDRDNPCVAPIGELATLLSAIDNALSTSCNAGDAPGSLADHITARWEFAHYSVRGRLDWLEALTESDQVVWSLARTPPVKDHPSIDSADDVYETCLTTEVEGRRFFVLEIPSMSSDYPRFVASWHDGKLSDVLWPPPYESNLVPEAVDSWRRHHPEQTGPVSTE